MWLTWMAPREFILVQQELLRVLTQSGLDSEAQQVDAKIKADATKLQQQLRNKRLRRRTSGGGSQNEGAAFFEPSAGGDTCASLTDLTACLAHRLTHSCFDCNSILLCVSEPLASLAPLRVPLSQSAARPFV
jgi:hypothetical protein